MCSTLFGSACTADNSLASAAAPEDKGRIVNGKWDGWLHTKVDNGPETLVKVDTRAVAGTPCNKLHEWARDADDAALICVNDAPAQVPNTVHQNGLP